MRDEPSIQVLDMTDAEFEAYLERMLPDYAAAGAKATGMPLDAAVEHAREQLATLLPDGPATAGQHLVTVRVPSGTPVGILWYASELDRSPSRIFLYDIVVDEAQRGQGLGAACLRWLEEEALRLGASTIALHVFTDNVGAIRLYERLGFVATTNRGGGMQMTKNAL